jgi:hypothetical protein
MVIMTSILMVASALQGIAIPESLPAATGTLPRAAAQASELSEMAGRQGGSVDPGPAVSEFDRLGTEGNSAVYNLDYDGARQIFRKMTELAPDRPAGYVYLANNLWLETLNSNRRLSSSLYSSDSFYAQTAESDKTDQKRDKEFAALIKQAIAAAVAIQSKDPNNTEGLYYNAAALGLRAAYKATVGRSFRRAIGDANDSILLYKKLLKVDPNYYDAYLSVGLYEYVVGSLPFGWKVLARLAGLKGSKEKGVEHLEAVADRGKYTCDDARVILIGIYAREHKLDQSLEVISYLAAKYPRNYLFGVERAAMLYRANRKAEGEHAFAELLKDQRTSQAASDVVNYQWGEAVMATSDFAGALRRFSSVISWPKSDLGLVSLSHLYAAQSLDALGRRGEAIAEYKIVLQRENIFDSHERAAQGLKGDAQPSTAPRPAATPSPR